MTTAQANLEQFSPIEIPQGQLMAAGEETVVQESIQQERNHLLGAHVTEFARNSMRRIATGAAVCAAAFGASEMANPATAEAKTQQRKADWSGGSFYPDLVKGETATFKFAFMGDNVDNFTATFDKGTNGLRLLKRGSNPGWRKIDKKPTWKLGELDDENPKNLTFKVKVGTKAKIGKKACVFLHFEPAKGGTDPRGKKFGKICSKVKAA